MSLTAARNLDAELVLGGTARVWEGLLTTTNSDGSTNVAAMGPTANEVFDYLVLRPFASSTTYANLRERPCGVFHLTDDVEALANAVVQPASSPFELVPCPAVPTLRLADCCRWFAFELEWFDAAAERSTALARVVAQGVVRDFLGFNRAKHAVLEAAILATRLGILPRQDIEAEFARLATIVKKTGAAAELRAFASLNDCLQSTAAESGAPL